MNELYPPSRIESLSSALAELVPGGAGAFVKTLLVDSAHRQAVETGEVIRQVAEDVGEELFSRTIEESPRVRSLLLNALDRCYSTGFQQKRWRLAEALKECILDPSRINDAVVEQQALRDVEEPHVLVLNELAQLTDRYVEAVATKDYAVKEPLVRYERAWKKYPAPITAVLVNSGLAKELPPHYSGGAHHTLVTPYGVKVLNDFRRLGMQLDVAARPRV